jgi:chemotaxis protein histidine kinase CheA/CheY-like chemotaxis protein
MNSPGQEFVEVFLQEASEHLQYLREYAGILLDAYPAQDDLERLYVAAHTLKGSSAMYGFPLFSEIAAKLTHIFQYAMNVGISADAATPLVDFISEAVALLESDLWFISTNASEAADDIAAFKGRYPFAFQAQQAPAEQQAEPQAAGPVAEEPEEATPEPAPTPAPTVSPSIAELRRRVDAVAEPSSTPAEELAKTPLPATPPLVEAESIPAVVEPSQKTDVTDEPLAMSNVEEVPIAEKRIPAASLEPEPPSTSAAVQTAPEQPIAASEPVFQVEAPVQEAAEEPEVDFRENAPVQDIAPQPAAPAPVAPEAERPIPEPKPEAAAVAKPEPAHIIEVELPPDGDLPAEILEFFIPEVEEHLQTATECLLSLEAAPNENDIHRLFRSMHTIKGSAAQVGLPRIALVAHRAEDLIGRLRDGAVEPSPDIVDLCLESVDVLKKFLYRQWGDEVTARRATGSLLARIARLAPEEVDEEQPETAQRQSEWPLATETPVEATESPIQDQATQTHVAPIEDEGPEAYEPPPALPEPQAEATDAPSPKTSQDIAEHEPMLLGDLVFELPAAPVDPERGGEPLVELLEPSATEQAPATTPSRVEQAAVPVPAVPLVEEVASKSAPVRIEQLQASMPAPPAPRQVEQPRLAASPSVEETPSVAPAAQPNVVKSEVETALTAVASVESEIQPLLTLKRETAALPQSRSVRIALERLDRMMNAVGELVINRTRMLGRLAELERLADVLNFSKARMSDKITEFQEKYEFSRITARPNAEPAPPQAQSWGASESFPFRGGYSSYSQKFDASLAEFSELEMDRYDEFSILSRSLTEISADITEILTQLDGFVRRVDSDIDEFTKLAHRLQDEITAARMVPIGNLYTRISRTVRDAAKAAGKQVELQLAGAETELDNNIIQQIADPLLHLVRNSVAHGIERADERYEQGKADHGNVYVRAYHRGNHIYIEVEDDGRGLDYEKIRCTAVELGMVAADDANRLTERDLQDLLFQPGFSTAPKKTELAGRGVGLDVVKANLAALNGEVEIESQKGFGTRFTLKVPLTLIISQALFVRCGTNTYAFPLAFVEEIRRIRESDIEEVGGKLLTKIRDAVTEVVRLDFQLGLPPVEPLNGFYRLVIVNVAGRQIGIVVEEVLRKDEIVIKNLGEYLRNVKLFPGATIAPDGSLILLIDVNRLIAGEAIERRPLLTAANAARLFFPGAAALASGEVPEEAIEAPVEEKVVVLADDSISVRKFVGRMLEKAGYRVKLACDGLEALEIVSQTRCDLVVTDLEMPRTNGYELMAHLRQNPETKDIPVMVVTSRAGMKHRDKAVKQGAIEFLVKPVQEEQFVAVVQRLIGPTGVSLAASRDAHSGVLQLQGRE